MSDYVKISDFTAKDAAEDIIEGADFDAEFDAIATASSSKTDKAVPATANSIAGLNSAGNIYDTTVLTSDLAAVVSGATPTGFLALWPTNTPPSGWKLCDGSQYSTASEPDLFAVIGYTYGGSGANFEVPDLRGRFPLGQDDMGGASANVVTAAAADTLGGTGGAENHTLTTAEMPSHTHSGNTNTDGSHSHTGPYLGSTTTGASGDNKQVKNVSGSTDTGGAHSHAFTTNSAGSGSAHNNMPPYLTLNYIIKA